MSSDKITLSANKRDVLGKQVRGLRTEGQTPAVIHDHGKESVHITVGERELKKVFSSAGKHHPVNLKVDGKNYVTLIKEVTFKPTTNRVFHGVFQAIKANETVKAEIPVNLVGEDIPAEIAGLLVLKQLEHVEVEALPADLVDVIEIDATGLTEAGDKLTVADLKIPSGMDIKTDPEQTIATVEIPKDQVAEADAAAAELAEDAGTTEGEGEEEAAEGETSTDEEGEASSEESPAEDKKESKN
jgi:large subunit ribosomal protein L25